MSDSVIYKPQAPMSNYKGDKFYPMTSADQVVMKDGSRLNTKIISVDLDDVYIDDTESVNADTLGGYSADHFASATDVEGIKVTLQQEVNATIAGLQQEINTLRSTIENINNRMGDQVIYTLYGSTLHINDK